MTRPPSSARSPLGYWSAMACSVSRIAWVVVSMTGMLDAARSTAASPNWVKRVVTPFFKPLGLYPSSASMRRWLSTSTARCAMAYDRAITSFCASPGSRLAMTSLHFSAIKFFIQSSFTPWFPDCFMAARPLCPPTCPQLQHLLPRCPLGRGNHHRW
nr:hypothetical protein [Candidatus Sigynarchaeota archaeon]